VRYASECLPLNALFGDREGAFAILPLRTVVQAPLQLIYGASQHGAENLVRSPLLR
jgi:hypothetical protein